jgi:RHS repeat-associated protein
MLFIATSQSLVASNGNLPPRAIIGSDPSESWFYNGSDIVFTNNSQDYDGQITYTKWYINGVYQSGGGNRLSMPICFVLYDTSEPGNCYQMGQGQSTVSIKLQTRDNAGEWSSTTQTYTVKVHKGRRYFVKDHLGSVRATVDRDGVVIGHDDYYPFGLVMPGRSSNTGNPNDNYKFTGHELDNEVGLDIYYMGARYSDPVLGGRFYSIDPLAREFPNISPYAYGNNNPLRYTDPTGMAPMDHYYDANGNYLGEDELETDYVWITSKENYQANVDKGGAAIQENSTAITDAKLSLKGWSNLFTDIFEKAGYSTDYLHNGRVSIVDYKSATSMGVDFLTPARSFNDYLNPTKSKYTTDMMNTWMTDSGHLNLRSELEGGKVNRLFTTMGNIQSSMDHEMFHYAEFRKIGRNFNTGANQEVRAYSYQIGTSRFLNNTTQAYQNAIYKSLNRYLRER